MRPSYGHKSGTWTPLGHFCSVLSNYLPRSSSVYDFLIHPYTQPKPPTFSKLFKLLIPSEINECVWLLNRYGNYATRGMGVGVRVQIVGLPRVTLWIISSPVQKWVEFHKILYDPWPSSALDNRVAQHESRVNRQTNRVWNCLKWFLIHVISCIYRICLFPLGLLPSIFSFFLSFFVWAS